MKKRHLLAGALLSTQALGQNAPAPDVLPEGGQVVAGEADISQADSTLSIRQSSDRAAIDWNSFDVGSDAHVEFLQPSNSSVTLNRVTSGNASQIFGRITANGQVFLSNPNGVYFSPTASVNVGGLVATTHSISIEDFMAGRAQFERNGATGSIVNQGELQATLGGYIALLAPEVRNQGVILANLGTVAMAAGETFELQFGSNNTLANLRVTPSTIQALVDNRSAVLAPGGIIILSAQAVDHVQGGVIRNSGVLEATGLAQRGGRIVLEASGRIENTGRIDASATVEGPAGSVSLLAPQIVNSGSIDVSGSTEYSQGGSIQIAVGNLAQTPTGTLDVSAPSLGGIVDIQASGEVALAGRIDAAAVSDDSAAQGGNVTIKAAQIEFSSIEVDTSGSVGGQIMLDAAAPADQSPSPPLPAPDPGKVALLGNTQLNSRGRRGRGGSVTLLGDDISLRDAVTLVLTGTNGGGRALIGGDWQGSGDLHQATTVAMDAGVRIDVSATQDGNGGTVVLWSDVHAGEGNTYARGSIVARGGVAGGDGGRIETSGHVLDIDGIRIDAGADAGTGGLWLLDPYNYTINAAAAGSIAGTLNSGTSVTVTTANSVPAHGGSANSSDLGDIIVDSDIAKTAGGDATLTLQGHRRISVSQAISSSQGRLNVVLWADQDGNQDGGVAINAAISTNGGHLWAGGSNGGSTTWNGLTVGNGASIGATGANHNAFDLSANITTGGGDVLLWAGNGVVEGGTPRGLGVKNNATISAGSGNVSLLVNRLYNWDNANSSLTINSTGIFTVAPGTNAGWSSGLNWSGTAAGGNFTLTNTLGQPLVVNGIASLSGLDIGRYTGMSGVSIGNTANVTISNAISVAGGIGIHGGQININQNLTSTATGDIFIKSVSSANPSININADILKTGGATSTLTLQAQGRVTLQTGKKIQATGTALNTVLWSDYDNSNNDGGVSILGDIITNGGHLWAGGSNSNGGSAQWNGLTVGDGPSIGTNGSNFNAMDLYGSLSTAGGNVLLWAGTGFSGGTNGIDTNAVVRTINSGAGDVTIIADRVNGGLGITSSGHFTFAPNSTAWEGIATQLEVQGTLSGNTFTGSGDSSWLTLNNVSSLAGLTIGKEGITSHIAIDLVPWTINGPINLIGNNITVSQNLTTTAAGAGILLKASGNIVLANGRALQTDGGDITLWADSDAAGGGFIQLVNNNRLDSRTAAARAADVEASNGALASGGGDITLGGGNGATAADGYAQSANTTGLGGVNLGDQSNTGNSTTIYSGGGDVLIRGKQTGNSAMGVQWINGGTLNAGQGTVRIDGLNQGGGHGVELGAFRSSGEVRILASGGDASTPAIDIQGTGAAAGRGILAQVVRLWSTGAGGISLTGSAGASGPKGVDGRTTLDVLAASGPITIDGGSKGIEHVGSIGALANSPVPASSSDVTLTGDTIVFGAGTSAVRTTGTLTMQPLGASFASPFTIANMSLAGTITGLTLGKVGNTADITIVSAASIAGPIDIHGGNINLNANLASSAAGAGILVKASGSITSNNGRTFQTNNGDITFWSNASGANTAGHQTFGNSNTFNSANGATSQVSGGGRITFAGGLDDGSNGGTAGDDLPDGFAASNGTAGVSFGSNTGGILTSIHSGGGDIVVRGSSGNTRGIAWFRASNVQAGDGRLLMDGRSTQGHGIEIGAFINAGETNTFAADGGDATQPAIEIYGATTAPAAANAAGVQSADATLLARGAGGISVTGKNAGGNANGALNLNADLLAASGPITLTADGSDGLRLRGTLGAKSGSLVTASSSDVTLNFDKLIVNNGIAVDTTGVVTLQPTGASFAAELNLPSQVALGSGITGLTIGKPTNTANVTLGGATSIAGPITVHGGNINVNANLSATAAGADILLKASGNITTNAGRTFQTNNGDLIFWSDSDANGSGAITLGDNFTLNSANGATNQATGGGNITLAGGTSGTGPAASTAGHAVSLGTSVGNNGAIYSGGGDVLINGKTTTTSAADAYHGAVSWGALTVDAGQGTIAFSGESADSYGLTFSRGGPANATTLRSAATGGTAIGLSGVTTAANTHGLVLDFTTQENILATGGGDIVLTGRGTGTGYGVWLQGSSLLASSGAITIDGGTAGIHVQNASTLGRSTTGVTASSSNITLTGDRLSLAAMLTVDTTGTFTLQPYGTSFASALTWPANLSLAGTISGLTLGKSGNTANITLSSATTVAGPIAIYGGDIILNAALTATGSTITLAGTGNITRGVNGYVAADSLRLLGGNVTLDSTSNAIGTLAASGVSGLTYVDSNALVLGTVGDTNGVSASGEVNISTLSGDLTIAQNVATTNTAASALTLNAGRSATAGTANGGNLILSGSPTVSVGAGGTARLYTGSVAGSTGLTALIGSGSGRFRYNSDESATNYTLALGTGLYAIYREQPTVTRVINDQTMVYADSLPTLTLSVGNGLNGDTYAQAFATAPTVGIGGAQSSSGNWVAGSHALTGTGGSNTSQLGYAVSGGITGGTLTVTPRTLTVSYSAVNREYDGTTFVTVTDSDNRIGGDLLNITQTAAFNDANAGTGKTVDVTGIGMTGTDAGNYTLAATSTTTTANITPRTVTLSSNRVYDGTTALGAGTVAIGNLVGNQTLTFSGASANDGHVATGGKYISAITLLDGTNGGLSSNYQLPSLDAANAPVTITPRAITGSAVIGGVLSRTYDGTTAANDASVSGNVTGAVSGDAISLDLSAISLAYDSAHVANATSIGASGAVGFSIDSSTHGSQASDYSFTAPVISPVAAGITPATLTPTLTNSGVTRTYDGTTDVPVVFVPAWSFAGLISGDTAAALTYSDAAYNSKDVATASNITVVGLAVSGITGSNGSMSSDYVLAATSGSVAASITPRAVTVVGLAVGDKIYDGTNTATITNAGSVSTGVGSETLTLSTSGATFSDANAGSGKTVTATGYTLFNGSNGGLASNYALTSTTATATANIDRAVLTITANDDAKFVTRPDLPGYNGVSYSGFVNGETAAVLTGSASIARSNAGTNSAGSYADVLVPDVSGLSSGNYSFAPQNGDYTIVAANQLLVRVANDSAVYGINPGHTISSAEYFDGNTVITLTSVTDNGNGTFTVNDGAGGSATFAISLEDAPLSGAGFARVGTYQLGATGVTTQNAQNFSNQLTLVGSRSITQRAISATTVDGVSKVYDGTTAMIGIRLGLIGTENLDIVNASGTGAFDSRNAGSNIGYTVSGLALSGDDAANYYLTGGTSFNGSNGTITPRTLTVNYSGVSRVYDGSTDASVTSSDDRIAGDAFTINTSAVFADKNVGIDKVVTISGVNLSGPDSGNYTVASTGSTTADITRLDSVTWIGGAGGNWFDPANWAGGAVPDLANVANVVIPAGVNVTFDTTGAVAPAQAGPVQLDSLGNGGSLIQNDGELAVGGGGVNLEGFTQHGGTLGSDGAIVLDSFTQTGGSTATSGNFEVNGNFSQGTGGSVSVGGNADITDALGGTTVGNLNIGGELHLVSTDGSIVQANGTTLTVGGNTTVDAGSHDIMLNGPGNDFTGPFNARGNNIAVTDGHGGLVLGNVAASGALSASSAGGNITQTDGSTLAVTGRTALEAPGSQVVLNASGNSFGGGLIVVDASPSAVMPPVPPPAAPALSLPSPDSAPIIADFGLKNVSVSLITAPSDQNEGLVSVEISKDTTYTGFSFALPEEVTQDLPAGARITATQADGGRLPAWLTFDPQNQRFVAAAIPATALPLRALVTIGERRVAVVISIAEED